MIKDLIKKARTFRRFKEKKEISKDTLTEIVDCARLSASPRNQQALKFMLVNDTEKRKEIFKHTAWAGALKDWKGPTEGERPAAYILIFDDLSIIPDAKKRWQEAASGIAAQSMVLAAAEKGIGACIIAAVNRKAIIKYLKTESHLDLLLVIALGESDETVKLEEMKPDDSSDYYRDEHDVHHVPKRVIDEILI